LASLSEPTGEVEVNVSEQLPPVRADGVLLERVIANVVSNSLRYSPAGMRVRIEAGEVGPRVDLRIIDRGPGVRPDDRDRIFEPFQRLGDRASGPGVGLGLAVARGFTSAMGGDLSLDDTPGGGLTTIISLVKAEDGSPGADLDLAARPGSATPGANLPSAPRPDSASTAVRTTP